MDGGAGVDQSEVAQRLREVAEERTRRRVDLLGEQPDVVLVGQELLEERGSLVDVAAARERLDEPERTGDERAFAADVAGPAPQKAAARVELLANPVDRPAEPLGRDAVPAHARGADDGGVERPRPGVLDVGAELVGPALLLDVRANPLAFLAPGVHVIGG